MTRAFTLGAITGAAAATFPLPTMVVIATLLVAVVVAKIVVDVRYAEALRAKVEKE